ncbi:hypothetical protein [Bradyrhizobium sp. B117]|uniref:hypothetical protein n=1 Tax=Bradyrhizobium sp. B117 TaxID=3140246 RepID=UPI003182CFCE
MLRRIPAVKWAFTRLRPLPHGGSIDVAANVASDSPAILADVAEAAPTLDASSAEPLHGQADITATTPVAEDEPAIAVIAKSPSATPADISINDEPSRDMPTEADPVVVEQASVLPIDAASEQDESPEVVSGDSTGELLASIEPVIAQETPVSSIEVASEPADAPEADISSVPSYELATEFEHAAADETLVASVDVAIDVVDAPVLLVADDPTPDLLVVDAPAANDGSCVACADDKALDVSESNIDSDPAPSVAAEIEPVAVNDPAPVMVVAAEDSSADATSGVAESAPEPVLESPVPEILRAPKTRTRVTEPADRAALIRQRWAETGIRMWNPRLHGTGDATLNIQGRIGLLPPAPGETMPRYDKLEFKMLGGQIVCEGVIVEAPAQVDKRSFTRLAEPVKTVREAVRERQAALA